MAETWVFNFAGPNLLGEKLSASEELFLLFGDVEKGLRWWGLWISGVVLPQTGV